MTNVETRILLSEACDKVAELDRKLAAASQLLTRMERYTAPNYETHAAFCRELRALLAGESPYDHRLAELGAENATLLEELSALRGEAQERENAAIQQGLAVLADLRAEHDRQNAETAESIFALTDKLAEAQAEGRL